MESTRKELFRKTETCTTISEIWTNNEKEVILGEITFYRNYITTDIK